MISGSLDKAISRASNDGCIRQRQPDFESGIRVCRFLRLEISGLGFLGFDSGLSTARDKHLTLPSSQAWQTAASNRV